MNQKVYMTDQEFTARMAALIPAPSAEVNDSLLDLAHSLWFEMKEDLYHTFRDAPAGDRQTGVAGFSDPVHAECPRHAQYHGHLHGAEAWGRDAVLHPPLQAV